MYATTLKRPAMLHSRRPVTKTRTPRILCIDDDPAIHTAFQLRMREYDIEVAQAFYGMQGVAEAVRTRPDVIVMDIAMPNGDGLYVLQCLRSNPDTASVPVVMLSGMRDPALKRDAFDNGADSFLTKPVAFTEVVEELSQHVRMVKRDSGPDIR